MKIRVGIAGYGNLGRGVELALQSTPDMELVGVFTRRNPETLKTISGAKAFAFTDAEKMKDQIDVMILCGGSAKDLPKQTAELAQYFNVIDSFDTHANIPAHFDDVDAVCKKSGTLGIISVGWDPGLFSLMRLYGQAVLLDGADYTFWGKGVSQGHSDAIRRIEGVQDAKQYTIPVESALDEVRKGTAPVLSARQKHTRECFVVAKDGADKAKIEKEIKEMPNYFADYDTTVHFISQEELNEKHAGMAHGGMVFRTGKTGQQLEHNQVMEFKLTLDSNPEFTSRVLVAFARAAYRLSEKGESGCRTVLDIAPALLHPADSKTLRESLV